MKRVLLTIALLAAACAPPLVLVSTARAQEHDRQCFFVAAGKSATADGAILLGYNNDWAAANWMSMRVVGTRGASSHRFLKFHTKVAKAEGGLNEHQLGLVFGAATDIDKAVLAADPYLEHGYGYELWDLILRRCRTARQAIDTLGRMAASKGFKAEAAGSLAVGDPGEVWVFELLGGRHWAAARVPDDAVWIHPNMVCIREIDLRDQERFRGPPDLEEFAVSLGRYDPDDGPFDVAWAYADRDELQSYYNTNRLWGAVHKLAPSLRLPSTTPWAKLPVHVVPDKKVTRQRIAAINRYHYEGTPLDQTDHYRRVSPHAMTEVAGRNRTAS
jgi:dipeptidase